MLDLIVDRNDTSSKRHLIETTFDRNGNDQNDTRSKRHLIETTFDQIMKEKIYNKALHSHLDFFFKNESLFCSYST